MAQNKCAAWIGKAWFAGGLAALLTASMAHAAWPDKPIQLIVAYPPGGLTDALARAIANPLAERLKQVVIVQNVPGGGGNIGAAKAAKSPADGYTIYLGNNATVGLNTLVYKSLPFDPLTELAPVTLVVESHSILVVHPSVAAHDVTALVALAKSKPDNWFGVFVPAGTPREIITHLNRELVAIMANASIQHWLVSQGAGAVTGTSEEFSAFIRRDLAKWARVVKDTGITPE